MESNKTPDVETFRPLTDRVAALSRLLAGRRKRVDLRRGNVLRLEACLQAVKAQAAERPADASLQAAVARLTADLQNARETAAEVERAAEEMQRELAEAEAMAQAVLPRPAAPLTGERVTQ